MRPILTSWRSMALKLFTNLFAHGAAPKAILPGKWHLGFSPALLPNQLGFDEALPPRCPSC